MPVQSPLWGLHLLLHCATASRSRCGISGADHSPIIVLWGCTIRLTPVVSYTLRECTIRHDFPFEFVISFLTRGCEPPRVSDGPGNGSCERARDTHDTPYLAPHYHRHYGALDSRLRGDSRRVGDLTAHPIPRAPSPPPLWRVRLTPARRRMRAPVGSLT